jgi:hypothetical protein
MQRLWPCPLFASLFLYYCAFDPWPLYSPIQFECFFGPSGMIETKESDFGFPLALVCATIPYAHRDHI